MHQASLRAGALLPAEMEVDSVALGWRDVLCRTYREHPVVEDVVVAPTPDLGLVAVLEGSYVLESRRGSRWVAGHYRPGSVGVKLPDEDSRLRWHAVADEPMRSVQVHLPARLLRDVADVHGVSGRRQRAAAVDLADPYVFHTCRALARAAADGAPAIYADTIAHALAVYLLVAPAMPRPEAPVVGVRDARLVADVMAYMREHLAEPLTLDDLAAVAHLSKWHFLRRFAAVAGTTPLGHLTRLRVARARELLEAGWHTADVVAECGFGSSSHFARTFRRFEGMSPRELRSLSLGAGARVRNMRS